jgi:hypothetical protein
MLPYALIQNYKQIFRFSFSLPPQALWMCRLSQSMNNILGTWQSQDKIPDSHSGSSGSGPQLILFLGLFNNDFLTAHIRYRRIIGKDVEGSCYSLSKSIITTCAWMDWRKPQNILARIVTPQAKNWTQDLLHIKQKCCPLHNSIW